MKTKKVTIEDLKKAKESIEKLKQQKIRIDTKKENILKMLKDICGTSDVEKAEKIFDDFSKNVEKTEAVLFKQIEQTLDAMRSDGLL